MVVVVPALPGAFAHGGMQPPAADFNGKKASLSVKVEPMVVTAPSDPVYINARFFDENTNENFKEVTYRVFFEKDGNKIPIVTEGGQYGGQGFFYDPGGDLQIKVVPKDTDTAVAKGESETQFGGIWNRGGPVVVEGPIFTEPGLYNLFIEIHTVGTTRTQVEPILKYDIWVTPGREEVIDAEGQQIKVRSYYGAIQESGYNPDTKRIEFALPFNWSSDLVNRVGMLHTEVFIPKAMSDFNQQSLNATVDGISVPVAVDTYNLDNTIVHFTISKTNLANIASRVLSEGRDQARAVFALSPPTEGVKVTQISADSANYKVALTWPDKIFPGQPMTFGIRLTDRSDAPLSGATYELVLIDKDGNEVIRSGGVTTPEGVGSQDVTFASQGSFTMRVDKINASSESIQSSITVVPEFPVGIASIAGAVAIAGIIAAKRTTLFGKTY